MEEAFNRAVSRAGSIKALADALGESVSTVCNWRHRGIPPHRAKAVEMLTGVSVRETRPVDWRDYWPETSEVTQCR